MEITQSNTIIEEFINDLAYDFTYYSDFSEMPTAKTPKYIVTSSITMSEPSLPATTTSVDSLPTTSTSDSSSSTTSTSDCSSSSTSTSEVFSCNLPLSKPTKNQKLTQKRREKKIKTASKKNSNRRKLCKHIMSVEFSLEYQLNAVMKYPRIAELTESKLHLTFVLLEKLVNTI